MSLVTKDFDGAATQPEKSARTFVKIALMNPSNIFLFIGLSFEVFSVFRLDTVEIVYRDKMNR
jgi:hypothetical protein